LPAAILGDAPRPNQPRFGSWSRVGHPNRKDQKDFKDEKDEKKVTFTVSGFAAIKSIPLNGLLDTFFVYRRI
jgi:hypothetical protein